MAHAIREPSDPVVHTAQGYDSPCRADLRVGSMVVKYLRIQIPLSVAIPCNGCC